MINYRYYAFKIALDEMINKTYIAHRDVVFDGHIPFSAKIQLEKEPDPQEKFFECVDRYKELSVYTSIESLWEHLDPLSKESKQRLSNTEEKIEKLTQVIATETGKKYEAKLSARKALFENHRNDLIKMRQAVPQSFIYKEITETLKKYREQNPLPKEHLTEFKGNQENITNQSVEIDGGYFWSRNKTISLN